MAARKSELFKESKRDFDKAVQAAQVALDASTSPAMRNLVLALASFSRANLDTILGVWDELDDINRKIDNVAARLDGKQGPFSLKMR
jgi:hypothetical protein